MIKNQFPKREAVRYGREARSFRLGGGHAIAVLLLWFLSGISVQAGILWGDLRGVTLDQTGKALSEVQITIHNLDDDTTRTVVSGSEGSFRVINLRPGRYQLTGQKAGFARAPETTAQVVRGQDRKVYLVLTRQDETGSAQSHLLRRAPAERADMPSAAIPPPPDVSPPATNLLAQTPSPAIPSAQQEHLQILKELEAMKQRITELEARRHSAPPF